MGGEVHVDSVYGKGSTFSVTLTQQLAQEGFQGSVKDYEEFLKSSDFHRNINDTRPFTCPNAKILVVDDTPVNLVVAKGMLSDTLAQVSTCDCGEDCLKLLETQHFDIVFLDHKMPGIDGIETLRRAKDIDGPSRLTPFIALTANSGSGARDEYISYGFNDYLPKPMKSEAIRDLLARYIPEALKVR